MSNYKNKNKMYKVLQRQYLDDSFSSKFNTYLTKRLVLGKDNIEYLKDLTGSDFFNESATYKFIVNKNDKVLYILRQLFNKEGATIELGHPTIMAMSEKGFMVVKATHGNYFNVNDFTNTLSVRNYTAIPSSDYSVRISSYLLIV